jgi:hypothetical protein
MRDPRTIGPALISCMMLLALAMPIAGILALVLR